MRADQVGVVDVAVIEIAVGLHLRLNRLDDFAFAEDLVVDLDAGDFLEGLGQDLGFIVVRRDVFRQHVDLHALEGFGGLDEPLHLLQLVCPSTASKAGIRNRPISSRHPCPRRAGVAPIAISSAATDAEWRIDMTLFLL